MVMSCNVFVNTIPAGDRLSIPNCIKCISNPLLAKSQVQSQLASGRKIIQNLLS